MPLSFGESPILIQTDKKEYSIGDDIILQGTVKFVNGKAVGIGLPKNLDVAIEVYNSKNQLIISHIVDVKNDDSFFLKIKTGKNSSILIDDRYFFVAYYGIATRQLLNSDFVGKYDVYVGVSALNPNISSNPIQDNTKPNISPPNNSPPPTLDDPTVGLFVFVACMAIIFGLYFGTPFFKSKKTPSSQIYRNPSNHNRRNYSNPTRSNYKKRGPSAKWSKRASKVWAKSFKELMAEEFGYNMQLAQMKSQGETRKEQEIEDRKDSRIQKQGTQESQLINQRQNNTLPQDFEYAGFDGLGGFGLEQFSPR